LNTLEQAGFIVDKMDENLDGLPDDQPYYMTAGEARAYKETLEELRLAVEQFSELKLGNISICHVASDALQNPHPSIVQEVTTVDVLQYAEIRDRMERLHRDLHKPEDNGGG